MRLEYCDGAHILAFIRQATAHPGKPDQAQNLSHWLSLPQPRRIESLVRQGIPLAFALRADAAARMAFIEGMTAAKSGAASRRSEPRMGNALLDAAFVAGFDEFTHSSEVLCRYLIAALVAFSLLVLALATGLNG